MTGGVKDIPQISIFQEMMKTTMTLATNLHVSPFDIYAQDCDEVIMTINFYLVLSAEKSHDKSKLKPKNAKNGFKEERIRVNDKTATGGWF